MQIRKTALPRRRSRRARAVLAPNSLSLERDLLSLVSVCFGLKPSLSDSISS